MEKNLEGWYGSLLSWNIFEGLKKLPKAEAERGIIRDFPADNNHSNKSVIRICEEHYRTFYGHGVDTASNRNEYQKYFLEGKGGRCVELTTLPPSCADYLEIWEPQPPGTLRACPGL